MSLLDARLLAMTEDGRPILNGRDTNQPFELAFNAALKVESQGLWVTLGVGGLRTMQTRFRGRPPGWAAREGPCQTPPTEEFKGQKWKFWFHICSTIADA
jgi:hypothetical protein